MEEHAIIDFIAGDEQGAWRVINDGVMGGVSQSEFSAPGGSPAVFRGTVSLENNGGFASVRTAPGDFDLGGFDGVTLRVRGDGKRYQFRLRTDDGFDGVAYRAIFDTRPDSWITVRLPFSGFEATWRGRRVADAPSLDPGRIRQIGFLIAGKQAGAFCLEVERISGYRDEGTETAERR